MGRGTEEGKSGKGAWAAGPEDGIEKDGRGAGNRLLVFVEGAGKDRKGRLKRKASKCTQLQVLDTYI